MEAAVDAFYSDPSACRAAEVRAQQASVGTSRKNLEKLWEKYKGSLLPCPACRLAPHRVSCGLDPANPLESDFEGTVRFCEDLGVEPSDVIVLALAWLLTAPSMPRFAKVGYVDGWLRLGCVGPQSRSAA
jgi:DCN1-like protein 1/2